MIKEVSLTNFYSFDQAVLQLQPSTNLLIGINGSGKSNFFKAIRLLKEGVSGIGLRKHILDTLGGFDNIYFKGNSTAQSPNSIKLQFTFDAIALGKVGYPFKEDVIYQIDIIKSSSFQNYYIEERLIDITGHTYLDFSSGNGLLYESGRDGRTNQQPIKYSDFDPHELALKETTDTDRYYALTTIKKAIRDIEVYDYFDTTPKSLIRKPMLPTSEKKLIADGLNLPQILHTLKINHKQAYKNISAALNEVNPHFVGFDFNYIGGNIELLLEEAGLDNAVHVSCISDGTLRYLCLLAVLYNPDRGQFICIDEPEVGLHPDMIANIANAIKEAAETSTIVLSTHSENLLNYFNIEQVRVFEKDDHNATQIITYTADQFSDWYEEFSLGQMWKQGDLGGVRYGS